MSTPTKSTRNAAMLKVIEHQTAKRLIAMKFRGVMATSLTHSHTNDLGMIFRSASGRKFLVRASNDIVEV